MSTRIISILLTAALAAGIASSALAGEDFHQVKDERGVIGHVRGDGLSDDGATRTDVVQVKAPTNKQAGKIGFDWRRASPAERAHMNELYHGEGPKW